jgi:hypothetical protein
MAVGVEPQKIAKGLDGNDRSGDRPLEKHPQGLPGTAIQLRKERTIIEKITPKDLGDTEDKMTVGNLF